MRVLVPLLALALLTSLAPMATSDPVTHVVHIAGFLFSPGDLTVNAGDSVQWVNDDGFAHTATDSGFAWDTGTIGSHGSVTLLFAAAGSFSYHCAFHGFMSGTLHVDAGNLAPDVSIDAPADGAAVQGTVSIAGSASDADGVVDHVEVRVDGGAWQAADGTTTWSFAWDSEQAADGPHLVEAQAVDEQGLASEVASLDVSVANPPSVAITSPTAGSTVNGVVTVAGTASDPGPAGSVASVQVAVDDGAWQDAAGTSTWSFTWHTRAFANGAHTVHARSQDAAGFLSAVASLAVTINNGPPTVAITSPSEGVRVGDTITVTGTAAEEDGSVTSVEVAIDEGAWQAANGTNAWSFAWDTLAVPDGPHTVRARSSDGALTSDVATRGVDVQNHFADLAVQSVRAEAGLTSAMVIATLANEGDEAAGPFDVAFSYEAHGGTQVIGRAHVDALPVGAPVEVQVTWDTLGKLGAFRIHAVADPEHAVLQRNLANDSADGQACLPDLLGVTCLLPPAELVLPG
ncbi:MAG: hypothetical protein LC624_01340 [Halobacteriales archaeon]|nr:hypothetical protein [Halobacteriales archaeon]